MRFELMTMTLALKKKVLQAQMLVQIPCWTHGVSGRGTPSSVPVQSLFTAGADRVSLSASDRAERRDR